MIDKDKTRTSDFRDNFYHKYQSSYKRFTSNTDFKDQNSDYKIYKKRYLPLIEKYPKSARIIEIGCGDGYILQFLKENDYSNIYGIDISGEQIALARKRGLDADVFNVQDFFKSNNVKYDIVFALDFVEHFSKDELVDLFDGFYNLLEDNGTLIIHTPNGEGFFPGRIVYGDLTHLTIFNTVSLTQILRLSGFNHIYFFEARPVVKNLRGFIRLILWKVVRFLIRLAKIAETGGCGKIVTQSFVCLALKNQK